MSEVQLTNQRSPFGNASPTSTQRAARWRERRRRGVLFMANLEVMDRDLRVLKRFGQLPSDDPEIVSKDEGGAPATNGRMNGCAKRSAHWGRLWLS